MYLKLNKSVAQLTLRYGIKAWAITARKYKKFWEELIDYFPLILHRLHKKRRLQQSFYCLCILCRLNVFTEPLPSSDSGIQIDWRDL
jgi:hypothetical protein